MGQQHRLAGVVRFLLASFESMSLESRHYLTYADFVILESIINVLIINEIVAALYMTILQERDRFCYANTPNPNMPEWRDQGER